MRGPPKLKTKLTSKNRIMGRPPKGAETLVTDMPASERHGLTTIEIIYGVTAVKPKKFAAFLAGKADGKEVARQAKRLQRAAKRLSAEKGTDGQKQDFPRKK